MTLHADLRTLRHALLPLGIAASILATRGFDDVHPVLGGGMGSPQLAAAV